MNDETAHRTPHSSKDAPAEDQGGVRAPAREDTAKEPQTAQPNQPSWWERLLTELTPPMIWSQPQPSLREVVDYATKGKWTSADGLARVAGICWNFLFAIPASALTYITAWIFQRPARFLTVALIYFVLAHTGIGAILPYPDWMP